MSAPEPLIRVMALHALAYCERLFYLEEVEEIRVADAAVFDGRRVHEELDEGEISSWTLEAPLLGLRGRVDAVRRKDGRLVPIETKKGKSAPGTGVESAWRTDRIQVAAYGMVIEEALATTVDECRVKYRADGKSVAVRLDEERREEVRRSIERARALRATTERPAVAANERLCERCSLSPVCLPERSGSGEVSELRLLPAHEDRQVVHVMENGAHVGRSGDQIAVRSRSGEETTFPVRQVGSVVLHGHSQISSQALRLCVDHDVGVAWLSGGGFVTGVLAPGSAAAHRHLRQFRALSDGEFCLRLARRLVAAKAENNLRFVLRATRGSERQGDVTTSIRRIRAILPDVHGAPDAQHLLGCEGEAASAYFNSIPALQPPSVDPRLRYQSRSRRPSTDRFSALLNFGYGLLYRECLAAITAVGLHPGIGFYHQPRSAAHPLALDLMELFRGPVIDVAVLAGVSRDGIDADDDFEERGEAIWLSASGRKKVVELVERRKQDEWRHPAVGRSLSYARIIELEARLLEKEWTDGVRLFARFRLR